VHIDYTKLLPTQLRDTRWADILTVVGSILEDIKVAKIDIIKTQNQIMNMTEDQLVQFALNFGYTIQYLDGYTSTIDYLRKEVYTIIPRILNRTTILGYNPIFTIFNLGGNVYPMTYSGMTLHLTPYETWSTSDEITDLPPDTLDADGDFILFTLPIGYLEDLIELDGGGALDSELPVYDDPAHSTKPAITLDDPLFLALDVTSALAEVTRHLIIKYSHIYAENATEFLSMDTLLAFYIDVLNQKRRTEVIYFEPNLEIATTAQEILAFDDFDSAVRAIVLQSDGKILVGGLFTTYDGAACPTYLCRLNGDGSLDTTFNTAVGGGFNAVVYAIAIQPDGKILVGGNFTQYVDSTGTLTSCPDRICRLNSDGTLDQTFNYGVGYGFNAAVYSIAIQSDGKIIAGGAFTQYTDLNSTYTSCPDGLCRIAASGLLDLTFNYGVGTGFSGGTGIVYSVAIQSDGKILAGGNFTTYTDGTAVATSCPDYFCRVESTGLLDQTFNYGVGTGFDAIVYAVKLQSDGNILVGGNFVQYIDSTGTLTDCPDKLCRVATTGDLDQTFNYAATRGFNNIVYSIDIQTDGKILAGGTFTQYIDSTGTLTSCPDGFCRVNTATGILDQTFNYGVGTGFNNIVYAVAFQTANRLLAGGTFTTHNGAACTMGLAISTLVGLIKTSEGVLTSQTLYNYDHSITTYIKSFLLQPSLATVSKIRFGNGTHTTIDGTITDVQKYITEVTITNCDISTTSATELIGRRTIHQKNKFVGFSEIALMDVSNVCLYYATFPTIQYHSKMYSNIAFDISIV